MVVESASSSFESFLKSAILDKFFTHNSCARRPYASLRATPGCLLPLGCPLGCALSPPAACQRRPADRAR
jgi:hypothetical protein